MGIRDLIGVMEKVMGMFYNLVKFFKNHCIGALPAEGRMAEITEE